MFKLYAFIIIIHSNISTQLKKKKKNETTTSTE